MEVFNSNDVVYMHEFEHGFACCVDKDGIIWFRNSKNSKFWRPCMRFCYFEIKAKCPIIAKYVLSLACEIQDDISINARALLYDK